MKTTFATLAAAGLLLGGTAAFAADAPYSAPTPDKPGVQSQGQDSVPAAPSASGTPPTQQDQGASKRPLPGEPGYTPGQSLAPGATGSSSDLGRSGTATTPQSGDSQSGGASSSQSGGASSSSSSGSSGSSSGG
jgi:hypothetical protein